MEEEFNSTMRFLQILSENSIPHSNILEQTTLVTFLTARKYRWVFFFGGNCHINERGQRALDGYRQMQKANYK